MLQPKSLVGPCLAAALAVACGGNRTTNRPSTANLPAAQLAQGDGYRHVYPGFVTQSALAEGKVNETDGTTTLSYLVKGADPVQLSTTAESLTVHVAPAEPGSALFLTSPDVNNVGTLDFVDLAADLTVAVPLDGATGVPAEGFWYGATGRELLFLGQYDVDHGTGALYWSDGDKSIKLIDGVSPKTVLFSKSGATALVGAVDVSDPACDQTGADPNNKCVWDATGPAPSGGLYAVDLKTGTRVVLASKVLLMKTFDVGTNNEGRDLQFALSADGTGVVYVSTDGQVYVVPAAGGEPHGVGSGLSPAIDPSGKTVVYYAPDPADTTGSAYLLMKATQAGPTLLADKLTASVMPEFSSDGAWVTYFSNPLFGGVGAGAVADPWLVSAAGDQDPVPLGRKMAIDSVQVDPKTKVVVGVGDLVTGYDASGNVYAGPLGASPKLVEGATHVRASLGRNLVKLEESGSYAVISEIPDGFGGGKVSTLPPKGAPVDLGTGAEAGSIRAPHGFDAVVWIGGLARDQVLDGGLFDLGTLYGSNGTSKGKVVQNGESGVIQAEFGRDGRVLTLVGAGDKAGIWTLPAPK